MRRGRGGDGRRPWARLRRDRRAMLCLAVLAAELLAVLLLPPLLGLDPYASDQAAGYWAPPSAGHLLGTDDVGRDLLARLVYGKTLSVREKEYVLAARALGAGTGLLLRRNVLPNVISPVWCALPLRAGRAILSESSLSFLGVGIRTPQASWGSLLRYAASLPVLAGRPWVWLPPAACMILTVLCLQGLGDSLGDALDPRRAGRSGSGTFRRGK